MVLGSFDHLLVDVSTQGVAQLRLCQLVEELLLLIEDLAFLGGCAYESSFELWPVIPLLPYSLMKVLYGRT